MIETQEQLRSIFGEPKESVRQKVVDSLDDAMREFVQRSPLIFLSTSDEQGLPDVSPKGDAPGFVHIDDNGNLLIPDRPGNKLLMGFENILRSPKVGLIFVIPNTRETLRVKGVATLSNAPELLNRLSAKGKPAVLCTIVQVQECFFHCGKAMIRSGLWKPETWPEDEESLMVKSIAKEFSLPEADVDLGLEDSYQNKLY